VPCPGGKLSVVVQLTLLLHSTEIKETWRCNLSTHVSTTSRSLKYGDSLLGHKQKHNKRGELYITNTEWRFSNDLILLRFMIVRLQPQLLCIKSACALFYCHLWPLCLRHIFLHYLHYLLNGTFSKKIYST